MAKNFSVFSNSYYSKLFLNREFGILVFIDFDFRNSEVTVDSSTYLDLKEFDAILNKYNLKYAD